MESMKTEYTIKKFASLVIIYFSKEDCANKEFVDFYGVFENEEISKEIIAAIEKFLGNYREIIDKISIEEFRKNDYLSSKRVFMNQLLSRCFKLSEDEPTFFEFLLVCVYICKFTKCIYSKYKCFKILNAISDCLEIVYFKKYWNYFKEHDDFLGFAEFCKSFKNREPAVGYGKNEECLMVLSDVDFKRKEKVKILGCLNKITSSEIEVKIPSDMKCFDVTSKDEPTKDLIRKNKQTDDGSQDGQQTDDSQDGQQTVDRTDDSQDEENGDWEILSKKTAKPDLTCKECESKCFQYPEYLVRVLKSCEIVRIQNNE